MKIGQAVTLVGATTRAATVLSIVGAGESGYKILDLSCDAAVVKDVLHERDAIDGRPYWTLDAVSIPEPTPEPLRYVTLMDDAAA